MSARSRRICNLHSRRWQNGIVTLLQVQIYRNAATFTFAGTRPTPVFGPAPLEPDPGGSDGQEFANAVGDGSRQVAARRLRLQRRGWTRRYSRAASATKDWIAHSPRAHWILTRRQSRPDIRAVSVTRGSVGVRRLRLGPADIRERMSMRPPWRLARRGGRSMASLVGAFRGSRSRAHRRSKKPIHPSSARRQTVGGSPESQAVAPGAGRESGSCLLGVCPGNHGERGERAGERERQAQRRPTRRA